MTRPNILIVYSDQLRADALGCAGNPVVQTPNMDRLAREGARFTNAHVTFPLCCPFRAALMTGKHPHSTGMYANHYPIPLDQTFLADVLRRSGYQTGYVGKWHLNGGTKHSFVKPEERLGFERFIGFSRGHEYVNSVFYRDDDPQPRTSRRYQPDYQTDHLIELMDDWRRDPDGRPFFGMICYGLPHPPLIAPEHYLNMYSPDDVPINAEITEDEPRAREFLAKYYGLVTSVDDNVGKLLDWLDAQGLADNTFVLLVSDHGEMAGEHGHYGKKMAFLNSMHVPMLVRYPDRVAAGRVVADVVDPSVDTMPALLDLCGIPIPDEVQGVSYVPLLDGADQPTRDAIYYEVLQETEGPEKFPIPERGVRTCDWLYVRTEAGVKGLYDLKNDPLETTDLSGTDGVAEVMARLDGMLSAHMQRTGDDWGIEALFPPPDFQTHGDGAKYGEDMLKKAIVED
jgi:arylsulfatase A-like enzyme